MQIHDIQAFLAIVYHRSISRAAEELFVSQTAITHRLKNLELAMGVSLLDRGRGMKNIYLTPAGEDFLSVAERWDALWKETELLKHEGDKLSLSIGAVESLNLFVFPTLFKLLGEHIPKIRLEIHTQHTTDLYTSLARRQIDVGFVLRDISTPNICVTPWITEPMVVLKRVGLSKAKDEIIENVALDANNEIYIPWGPIFQVWHDQWWHPICPSRIKVTSPSLVFSLLQKPQQWIVVPMWVAKHATTLGNFTFYRLSDPPPEMICYQITHKFQKSSTQRSLAVLDEYLGQIKLISSPRSLNRTSSERRPSSATKRTATPSKSTPKTRSSGPKTRSVKI
jgi:DNA-binding transcriptional LysR family regulator